MFLHPSVSHSGHRKGGGLGGLQAHNQGDVQASSWGVSGHTPRGESWGVWPGGSQGVSRPTPGGVCRPTPGGVCIPARTEADTMNITTCRVFLFLRPTNNNFNKREPCKLFSHPILFQLQYLVMVECNFTIWRWSFKKPKMILIDVW